MRDRARDCDVSASLGAFWLTGLGDALGMSRAFSGVANADVGACVRVCVMKFESGNVKERYIYIYSAMCVRVCV